MAILTVLSFCVALATLWNLRLTGITIANGATCQIEEHLHNELCYDEDGGILCSLKEHSHELSCYSDPTADVETAEMWEATLPDDITEDWATNLIRIANSQIGYKESEKNYTVADDGVTRQGLTRYGQWYGNPHGNWSSMFLSFCLYYSNVPQDVIPWSSGVYNMMRLCEEFEVLYSPDDGLATAGNILFLDTDGNGNADRTLIITDVGDGMLLAVGGDWDDSVSEVVISADDERILAYIPTEAVRNSYLMSLPLYGIGKNNNVYTIDVYAIPVDYNGNRISSLGVTSLGSLRVNSTAKTSVATMFDSTLGVYQSAYFGSESSVSVDNISTVWRYRSGSYYLAYAQTNGSQNQRWKSRADTSISLYLRYVPEFTVTFKSEGFTTITEYVMYNEYPTITEPSSWERDGYSLVGWTTNDSQTVYTYDEIMSKPVTSNATYTAKWHQFVEVKFDLGAYADSLYAIAPINVRYGTSVSYLPTPGWKNNNVAMAFDGWYLDAELTQPVPSAHLFYENTTLYAKWVSKDNGYYVYFMDFDRNGQTPLVLMTYSVTEGKTASPYVPGNEPDGTQWDGVWYLEKECANAYNFAVPVSMMTSHLTGANNRDLYLYPGTQQICRAIFVTYGSKIDPVTVTVGGSIDLDSYRPERHGYVFAGWTLKDGTPVSGKQVLSENTTYYAKWNSDYVSFEAVLRIENANDTSMTQVDFLGTWYALSGSQIRVNSVYSGSGDNRTGTHRVVCVLNGVEYPVYKDASLTQQATLNDVYSSYYIYNNTGTSWTDEVNWDDIYTGGELPYGMRPISSTGDTIINFDYMRVRNDVVFTIPNNSSGGYMDIFKLYQSGLITGSVTYTGSVPTAEGKNVSATGVSAENIRWSYTAAASIGSNQNNYYTLHDMKYGQRIFEVYPVGTSWLTLRNANIGFHQYKVGSGQLFASRREDLSAAFFSGSGRGLTPYSLIAQFEAQQKIALMYAIECLSGETPDFIINGKGYKVQTQLCEVVNHTGGFGIKELLGCNPGVNVLGTNDSNNYYTGLGSTTATVGGVSVKTLFGSTYWQYYNKYVSSVSQINRAYIFYYDRFYVGIQFNFAYDSDGDGANENILYENIPYGKNIAEYQFGKEGFAQHSLLNREGYEFIGWLDANGNVLDAKAWENIVATGDSEESAMIFIAKWEKISNNIVEYYEDITAEKPFETHYFDDGEFLQYPNMTVYPNGWVWKEYGEGQYERFDWDFPMYGEYGVQEVKIIDGEEVIVNVIRVYGTWDESHTKVVYDPNAAQGGIPGTAPTDSNEYTIWQSEVSVMAPGGTANANPNMIFVGWLLDRNGIVYQPGDHVPVHWPRMMIFTAQWAKADEIVHLRYDPNGGFPATLYPDATGFAYKKNALASVWNNTTAAGNAYFTRPGYRFTGWNTKADGSGSFYDVNSTITLTQVQTTLYAQWESDNHSLSINKVDSQDRSALSGAVFGLYQYENGVFTHVKSLTTGNDGHIIFQNLKTDVMYKLVEERAPDGYAMISREIFFKLSSEETAVSLRLLDSEGKVISSYAGVAGEYITASNVLSLSIENIRGYALPSTGGCGISLYILCGLILTFGPFVYVFMLRRRSERRLK